MPSSYPFKGLGYIFVNCSVFWDHFNFDLAIHFGREDWPDVDLHKLSDEKMIAVASPNFVARHRPRHPEALTKLPLLHMSTRPMAWRTFFQQIGAQTEGDFSGKYFDQFSMLISAAVASLGAAVLPAYLIETELEDGRLVQLSATTFTTQNSYYLVEPHNRNNPAASAFADWVTGCVEDRAIV